MRHAPPDLVRKGGVTMSHSRREPQRNMLDVLSTFVYSPILKLIVILAAAFILVKFAEFSPNQVIELVKEVIP